MKLQTAYEQLIPFERERVDDVLRSLERMSDERYERITVTLDRFCQALEADELDERTRDLFAKPLVQAAIIERVQHVAMERDLSPARLVREHQAIALFNLQSFFPRIGQDGIPEFDATDATPADWAAIQSIEFEETYSQRGTTRKCKIKAHPKQVSLDALFKHTGLDKADNAQYLKYASKPAELVQLPQSASVSELAESYAKFIDGG